MSGDITSRGKPLTSTAVGSSQALDVNIVKSIDIEVSVDPDGLATSAKQDTGNTSLASIDTKLTGQATAANQATEITSLAAIAASCASIDAKIGASTGTITSPAQSPTSVVILAANANRKGFLLYNDASAKVYVAFAATASTTSYTLQMSSNSFYESTETVVYKGTISAIWNSGSSGNMRVTELT